MNLTGKNVFVAGMGISGVAAAALLGMHGIDCVLYDGNAEIDKDDVLGRISQSLNGKLVLRPVPGSDVNDASAADSEKKFSAVLEKAVSAVTAEVCDTGSLMTLVAGAFPEKVTSDIDLVVLSPGIPVDSDFVKVFEGKGIPIWGEVELAWYFEHGSVMAITGTNGKTTTTALVGAIMKRCCDQVFVVGNIGIPYTSVVSQSLQSSVTVAEISSFQLETTHAFHPHVSAILNVTPDHLNRHYTMENYANVKFSITKNQTAEDVCVLNYDNEDTKAFGEQLKNTNALFFSRLVKLERGVCLGEDPDVIVFNDGTKETEVCRISKMQLLGAHNVENVMAAVAMAVSMQVPVSVIREAVYAFQAVEHRIEFVAEVDGVAYYNDSKGTNTDAAIKGIEAMVRPTVLIGGGYDKKAVYDEWIEACLGKMKSLILIGQTAKEIADTAKKHGFTQILFAGSLSEAVQLAAKEASEGDAVLLSPACASWGMFKNYEERGRLFKEYVHQLQ